jgi:hypothetical protein
MKLSTVLRLEQKGGVIESRHTTLDNLEGLIASAEPATKDVSTAKQRKLDRVSSTFARLASPLEESKARKLLQELEHYKSHITLALVT